MKQGANRVDQGRIAKMAAEGKSVEEISRTLLIDEAVVSNFMPQKSEPAAKK